MNAKLVRWFGYFGIIAPIFGFAMVFAAISTAPWFSWTGNALSDLGVEGLTAVIFNDGLGMTACLLALFSVGVYEMTKMDIYGKASFVLLFAASVFLILIGIFPETAGRIHLYFSVAFFVTLPLAVWAFAAHAWRRGMRNMAYLSIASGVVATLIWAPSWDGVAIPEAVSALSMGIWAEVLGYWMIRRDPEEVEAVYQPRVIV